MACSTTSATSLSSFGPRLVAAHADGLLLTETYARQEIGPDGLTLDQDRGSPMMLKTFAQTCADLGVTKNFSRSPVLNDNPFSKAQFETLRSTDLPTGRFLDRLHAENHSHDFIDWYNREHHHGEIGLMMPHDAHHALASAIWQQRGHPNPPRHTPSASHTACPHCRRKSGSTNRRARRSQSTRGPNRDSKYNQKLSRFVDTFRSAVPVQYGSAFSGPGPSPCLPPDHCVPNMGRVSRCVTT